MIELPAPNHRSRRQIGIVRPAADYIVRAECPVILPARDRCVIASGAVIEAAAHRRPGGRGLIPLTPADKRKVAAGILETATHKPFFIAGVLGAAGNRPEIPGDAVAVGGRTEVIRRATASDGRTHSVGTHKIDNRAANDIGRAAGIRLNAQSAPIIYAQLQRLVVRRSQKVGACGAAVAPKRPAADGGDLQTVAAGRDEHVRASAEVDYVRQAIQRPHHRSIGNAECGDGITRQADGRH